jgi:hypothetical protein
MTLRTMPDTIASLRAILNEVEQVTAGGHNSADLIELRCILIHRIAELETAAAIPAEDHYKVAS